jgi:hypothetical protein
MVVHEAAIELHRIGQIRSRKLPWSAEPQPVLGFFVLPTAFNSLGEHTEFISNAVPIGRHADRSRAVEQARGQAAETAIAEPGIRLLLRHLFKIASDLGERLAEDLMDAKAAQSVHEQPADQEFHGEVAGFLRALLLLVPARDCPTFQHQRARECCGGIEPMLWLSRLRLDPGRLQQVPLERAANRRLVQSRANFSEHTQTGYHSREMSQFLILMQFSPRKSIHYLCRSDRGDDFQRQFCVNVPFDSTEQSAAANATHPVIRIWLILDLEGWIAKRLP